MSLDLPPECWLVTFVPDIQARAPVGFPSFVEKDILAEGMFDGAQGVVLTRKPSGELLRDDRIANVRPAWYLTNRLDIDGDRLERLSRAGKLSGQPVYHHHFKLRLYFDREQALADMARLNEPLGLIWGLLRNSESVVQRLARAVLDGDFATLAILADALEERGDPRADEVRRLGQGTWHQTREPLRRIGDLEWVEDMDLSSDGRFIACAISSEPISLFDAGTGAPLHQWNVDETGSIALSSDGSLVAWSDLADQVVLAESVGGVERFRRSLDEEIRVRGLAFHPNQHLLAVHHVGWIEATRKSAITLLHTAKGEPTRLIPFEFIAESFAFSPAGALLAVVGAAGLVMLVDPATGDTLWAWTGHEDVVHCVAFSPDGRLLATGGEDDRLCVWEAASGRLVWEADTPAPHDVAFAPGGKVLASAGSCGRVSFWDVATGARLRCLRSHPCTVTRVAFGGRRLFTAGDDSIAIWEHLPDDPTPTV
jgi:WD40 repeat protein